jgi:DNA-binding response OmpR family regulator
MLAAREVLVIDSDETICSVISDCLEEWSGTRVHCAHNGPVGRETLQALQVNLLLIDALLPGLCALDLIELAVSQNVPLLIFTSHPDVTTKLVAVDLPHLRKPFRLDDLLYASKTAVKYSQDNIARVRASMTLLKERNLAIQAGRQVVVH